MLKKKPSVGSISICTTVSPELWAQAGKYDIKWSEALRVGISTMLSEKSDMYLNPIQANRKMNAIRETLEKISREKEELEERLKKIQFGGV